MSKVLKEPLAQGLCVLVQGLPSSQVQTALWHGQNTPSIGGSVPSALPVWMQRAGQGGLSPTQDPQEIREPPQLQSCVPGPSLSSLGWRC